MIRIMFVCHGNICRSPMAEFIMKKLAADEGLEDKLYISSSATSTEEIWQGVGNKVYPPAKRELLIHGLDPKDKRAVQLQASDYDSYDLFIGMDKRNITNMTRILNGDKDNKIRKLMDYTPYGGDVADPWYSGDFETTYKDIYMGCVCLLEKIKKDI